MNKSVIPSLSEMEEDWSVDEILKVVDDDSLSIEERKEKIKEITKRLGDEIVFTEDDD